jgi:hypothetical protein
MSAFDRPPVGFVKSKTSKGACIPAPNPHAAKLRALEQQNAALRDQLADVLDRVVAIEDQSVAKPSRSKTKKAE